MTSQIQEPHGRHSGGDSDLQPRFGTLQSILAMFGETDTADRGTALILLAQEYPDEVLDALHAARAIRQAPSGTREHSATGTDDCACTPQERCEWHREHPGTLKDRAGKRAARATRNASDAYAEDVFLSGPEPQGDAARSSLGLA